MDVEAVVARRLARAVGVKGFVEVPESAPDSFISVERIGGGGSMFEPCQLAIDCWARKKERRKAQELAEAVKRAALDLDEEPDIFHPEVTNFYKQNDPDTGRSRYIVQIQVWVCE